MVIKFLVSVFVVVFMGLEVIGVELECKVINWEVLMFYGMIFNEDDSCCQIDDFYEFFL